MHDLVNNVSVASTLVPAVYNASTDGTAVDLQGFNGATLVVQTGAIVSAGDFSVKLQESDASGSGYTDVAAADLIGSTLPATLAASTTYKVGYRMGKRYVRAVATKAGGTSIALGITVVRSAPNVAPV